MPTLVSIDADSLKELPPSGAKRTVIVWLCPVPKLKLFPTVIRNGETETTLPVSVPPPLFVTVKARSLLAPTCTVPKSKGGRRNCYLRPFARPRQTHIARTAVGIHRDIASSRICGCRRKPHGHRLALISREAKAAVADDAKRWSGAHTASEGCCAIVLYGEREIVIRLPRVLNRNLSWSVKPGVSA